MSRRRKKRRLEPRPGGRRGLFTSSALVAVVLLMLYGGALFAGGYFTNELTGDGDESPAVAQPTPSPTATPPAVVGDVSADDDPALGPPDAKVLMVEFSDYQ